MAKFTVLARPIGHPGDILVYVYKCCENNPAGVEKALFNDLDLMVNPFGYEFSIAQRFPRDEENAAEIKRSGPWRRFEKSTNFYLGLPE